MVGGVDDLVGERAHVLHRGAFAADGLGEAVARVRRVRAARLAEAAHERLVRSFEEEDVDVLARRAQLLQARRELFEEAALADVDDEGGALELLRELMEIRGLGILNVRDLFGVSSLSGPKQIGLTIRLERWEETEEVDRLGLEARTTDILGVAVPYFLLPVSPGRNLSTLVETAVRVHLLRVRGHDAAGDFAARHAELIEGDFRRGSSASVAAEEGGAEDVR